VKSLGILKGLSNGYPFINDFCEVGFFFQKFLGLVPVIPKTIILAELFKLY
jgi:hypothetical protein